ncbi:glycosyltransferase family 31 protein [Aspergillus candidus]|uniref:Fringe-like glycosyltransferase domain-containing protein n=1 Tax=Aspergillus candidus TaxID=41067 RepID=A0A2I2FC44_ASPCN|nr:hypothetical protein BDW47DRAFT_105471 [Aspergillus candidus]PLB38200.1 hypothetical protein BDW47DRAFT_105471 [Aspergillus candidus]
MWSKREPVGTTMGPPMVARKRLLRFLVAICLVSAFSFVLWPHVDQPSVTTTTISGNVTVTSDVQCDPDTDVLNRLNIRKLSQYVRRDVIAVPSAANDPLPIKHLLNYPLFEPSLPSVDAQGNPLEEPAQKDCKMDNPITVQVPRPPRNVDASHIDFGVATTLSRLNDSVEQFAHWAGYTRTRIFALIEPDDRAAEVQAKADLLGINLYITESDEEYQRRYFSLVAHLAQNVRSQTRWSCIIDDDTFFMSMSTLVKSLSEYDDTKNYYVGGLSESIPQIGVFGLMGFGGAGVFLSRPLLLELSDPDVFEACQNMDFTGDRRISICVYQNTETHLTINHGLHQLDVTGDVSGFFESGRQPPLSVHHWKSWFHTDMGKLSVVRDICGDSCLLRQWQFEDGWILTNGYSIIKYSLPVDPFEKTMELTWDGENGAVYESYLHEFGPMRPKDEQKYSYRLEDAVLEGNQVRQWYVHRDEANGDQVFELTWRAG